MAARLRLDRQRLVVGYDGIYGHFLDSSDWRRDMADLLARQSHTNRFWRRI